MKQLPFQTRMEVLDLYLQGLSGDRVSEKSGVSKGAVISIIKDAREGKFPGLELRNRIDELHSLSVRLRKEGLDLSQAKLGFTFFKRLLDMDIEPDRIKEWVDFCSEISPSPPEGFIPAAMELFQIEKETGKSYAEIVSEVKELSVQRKKLIEEIGDLEAKEVRAKKLKGELEDSKKEVDKLSAEKNKLESMVNSLDSFLKKRAEKLGLPLSEFEGRLGELISLEEEIASKTKQKNRLEGELEALTERQEKLSSQMEKASSDFKSDLNLIRETRDEVARVAELMGRYKREIENMEWAETILPFLSDPDKVPDRDASLVSIVVNCLDKWIRAQPEWRFGSFGLGWDDIKRHVYSKRTETR
jgi:myosin heavy subunit